MYNVFMIRVISGKYRGLKLEQPPLEITRPTTDRTREAVFSSIQFDIKDSIILDLFAGSGANAIEAVSRGAMKAFVVEKNKEAANVIRKNIDNLGIKNISSYTSDVLSFLVSNRGMKFDFIFMDPPYIDYELYNETLTKLKKGCFLKTTGLIICETDNPNKINIPDGFVIQKHKKYGKAHILAIANNI